MQRFPILSLLFCSASVAFSLIIKTSSLSPQKKVISYILSHKCEHLDTDFGPCHAQNAAFTSIHLISLPKFSVPNRPLSQVLRWKRAALGDGGVYWDQRPNSLVALNTALAEHAFQCLSSQNMNGSWNTTIECGVISTCARFEILFSVQSSTNHASSNITLENRNRILIQAASECLAVQVMGLNRWRRMSWLHLDAPKRISTDTYSKWIHYATVESHENLAGQTVQDVQTRRFPWVTRFKQFITLHSTKEGKSFAEVIHWLFHGVSSAITES